MSAETKIESVAVYCGSSSHCDAKFLDEAGRVGVALAEAGFRVVYGGGSNGLMGRVADHALRTGAHVTGVIPGFMVEVEWAHRGLSDLQVVENMHERKRRILESSDAVVALPGGCGTLEELLEAITWKRLGLYTGPIVILNQDGFFNPCLNMLDACVQGRFMNKEHRDMWRTSESAADVVDALMTSPTWSEDALRSAPAR